MPNIEIHGFHVGLKDSNMLRLQIFELFKDRPFVNDMVVTAIESHVCDVKGQSQPFLRLLSSDAEEAEEILQVLGEKLPGIDVEYVKIERFIPKHMRER